MENSDATHKGKQLHVHYSGRCGHHRIHFSASHNAAKPRNTVEDKIENKLLKRMEISDTIKETPKKLFNIHFCQSHQVFPWIFCFNLKS